MKIFSWIQPCEERTDTLEPSSPVYAGGRENLRAKCMILQSWKTMQGTKS
jgi:hypothetical protein